MKKKKVKVERFLPRWRPVTHGTTSPGQLTQRVQTLPRLKGARLDRPVQEAPRARNGRHLAFHRLVSKFSLILSPPLALPLQLSVQRVCPLARTTAPPSSGWVAVPAATRSTPSPKASRSLLSVHRATLRLPRPPPRPSVCLILLRAPAFLPSRQTPAQLQPPHRPVATQGPKVLEPHHDPPPAH